MSRGGFTIGGIVVLALLIVAASLVIYLVSDYLYTAYQASSMMGRINTRLTQLSRSCIAYLVNGSLYFPYDAHVEYSIPSMVGPGYYHEINLSGINGEAYCSLMAA
ncbi:hypothetical protein [Vulcanisaeta distributa]|uniref:hypothetical protein n=1 Tax=Vulcanisaeta distributa TaxID=164451 RepID=UPI0006CF4DE1|nr:hypothetical protein [Vulcanisaeta distributa]